MTSRSALVLACACAAGACGDATGGSVEGPALYAKLCATCHGDTGKPQAAMAMRLGVRDLTAPELRARITPELVEKQVRFGSQNLLMPAFKDLISPEQVRAVAAYVASPAFLSPPPR